MDKQSIYLISAGVVFILFVIFLIILLKKKRVINLQKQVQELERQRNLIVSTPIASELAKIEVIVSTAKLYYESHKNSLGTSGCISISNLDLTENERKKSNGDMFTGGVSYTNGSNFEYKESCQ